MNYTVLMFVLLAWILWSVVRDVLPILALKEPKRYILPTISAALLPIVGLGALLALFWVQDSRDGYIWGVAFGFLAGTIFLEGTIALLKGERKTVSGRSGLKMPYRAPVSFIALFALIFIIPTDVRWDVVVALIIAGLLGIWGKNKLRSAEYWTTSELKDQERKKAKK